MKKIFLAAAILFATTGFAASNLAIHASKPLKGIHISASQVPSRILAQFWASYPTATSVKWEMETEHGITEYKVEFVVNGVKMKARYY